MDPTAHWTRARELFLDLSEAEAEERELALAKLAAEDPELCTFVARLLAQDRAGARPEGAASRHASAAHTGAPATERIGPFSVLGTLGEGGFGTVYRARQEHPIVREVALKVQKPGLDSAELAARFADERRYLARIDHPDVVKVLDAGTTDDGRLYVAMELVRGEPITEFVAREGLPLRERVALVARVARAVHHVHQRAILHRDLKPTNILVARVDGEVRPRLIDFGIATALSNAERKGWTRLTGPMCTPGYAAPEQLAGSENVDVRADVYALGCVLCECLTGERPREDTGPSDAPVETPARRPSKLVARRANQISAPWVALLRGDLDLVVLKCVAWEPDQRYESAAALADDLERFLRDEPVAAAPPSAWYVARKFARRHRGPVAVAAVALVLLLVAAAVALDGRRRAEDRRTEALAARDEARREAERAAAITRYLLDDMVVRLDLDARQGAPLTVTEMLAMAERNAEARFADDPRTRADVLSLLARSYTKAGQMVEARRAHVAALDAALAAYGAPSVPVFERRLALARHFDIFGDGDGEEQRQLAAHEADTLFEPGAPERLPLGLSPVASADTLAPLVAALRDHPDVDEELRLFALRMWASRLDFEGRSREGFAVRQELLERTRALRGVDHSSALEVEGALAVALVSSRSLDAAEPALGDALARAQRVLGEDHGTTRALRQCNAELLRARGRHAEALEIAESLVERAFVLDGEGSIRHANALAQLAATLQGLGRQAEAAAHLERVVAMRREHWGPEHPMTQGAVVNLAALRVELGDPAAALAALATLPEATSGRHASELGQSLVRAQALWLLGRSDEAEAAFEGALAVTREAGAPEERRATLRKDWAAFKR